MRLVCVSLLFSFLLYFFSGCVGAKVGAATTKSRTSMQVIERKDVLRLNKLPPLQGGGDESFMGGIPALPIAKGLVSLAFDGIGKMIAKEKSKYTATYSLSQTDYYFYDQISTIGAFDPSGMQFGGFTLCRTFQNKEGKIDTAFRAVFIVDTSRTEEIIYNSIFRLKLQEFVLFYAAAKIPKGKSKTVNMDFEILLTTSYAGEQGELNDNITLGKFYFSIRNAPLDPDMPNYKGYYENIAKKSVVNGRSFLVPRSLGYMKDRNTMKKVWGQGAYAIHVNIRESSKQKLVNRLLTDNAASIINTGKTNANKAVDKIFSSDGDKHPKP